MLRLRGSQAYSDFRIQKLLKTVQEQFPNVERIDTEFQHLIKLTDGLELGKDELEKLERLLSYGPAAPEVEMKDSVYMSYRALVPSRLGQPRQATLLLIVV